jgi:alanine racemase
MPKKTSIARGRVWLEIRLPALRRNFQRIRATVRPAAIMAVLKADAYGLGALPIAEVLDAAGVDRFGVAEV